jgi:hypothetical protein
MYYAGYSMSNPANAATMDAVVTKMNSLGQLQWSKIYRGAQAQQDQILSMIVSSDGHLVVAGITRSYVASVADVDGILMKINSSTGDVIWARTYRTAGHDEFFAVKEVPGGGYIVVGKTSTSTSAAEDALIMRTDSLGQQTWVKSAGGTNNDRFTDVLVTQEGNLVKFIASGFTQSFGAAFAGVAQREGMMIKFNDAGNAHWSRIYGGTIEDRVSGIVESADKQSYVVAVKTDLAATSGSDTVIARMDLNGVIQSAASVSTNFFDEAYEVIRAADGNYVLASMMANTIDLSGTDTNTRMTKISADFSSVMWHRVYGKSNRDEGLFSGLIQRADGGYAIAMTSTSYSATEDAMVVQTDELGRVNSAATCIEVQSPAQTITSATIAEAAFTPTYANVTVTRTNVTPTVTNLGVSQINACIP